MHSKSIIRWRQFKHSCRLPADWWVSRRFAGDNPGLFDELRTFTLFLGYSRSGHSAVAAILDAHPEAMIADELGILRYVHAGFSRKQLLSLAYRSAHAAAQEDRRSGAYHYRVKNPWPGRHEALRLLGDKQAEGATLRLDARPHLLGRFREKIGTRIRMIHVIRNPFDNIASMARHAGGQDTLDSCIERHLALCESVGHLKERCTTDEILDLRHEAVLAEPRETIADLLDFLGLETPPGYLEACRKLLLSRPKSSRSLFSWAETQKTRVARAIERHAFLHGYTYDES